MATRIALTQLRAARPAFVLPRAALFARPASVPARLSSTAATEEHKSAVHGSYHWNIERVLSVANGGLIATAVFSPNSIADGLLGVVLPLHLYLGFSAIIDDYLPKRRFTALYHVSKNLLRVLTLLTFYSFYQLNTTDVGISEFARRVWRSLGKPEKK